jgi:undecaprenyl-diphosphatase
VRSERSRLALAAVGFLVVLACLLVLGVIAEDIREQEAITLDAIVTPFLHGIATPGLDAFMRTATDLASTPVLGTVLAVAVVLLVRAGRRREALFLVVAIGGSVVLNQSLKVIFERPRPQLEWARVIPEYSFPSGHAMNSLVFCVALGLIAWRVWGRRAGITAIGLGAALALLIGTSRIYLGYHYFSDVVAGFLAGLAWVLVLSAGFSFWPWRDHGSGGTPRDHHGTTATSRS